MAFQKISIKLLFTSILFWVIASGIEGPQHENVFSLLIFNINLFLYFYVAIQLIFLEPFDGGYASKFGVFSLSMIPASVACGIFSLVYKNQFLSLIANISLMACVISLLASLLCLIWLSK